MDILWSQLPELVSVTIVFLFGLGIGIRIGREEVSHAPSN